ncbi:MAG: hypothetical protein AAFZ58_09325 [Pseudomonadota bacterium]
MATVSFAACEDAAVRDPDDTVTAQHTNNTDPWADVENAMGVGQSAPTSKSTSAPPISSLVGRLEARADADPTNEGHWVLLAQTYSHLGRDADAERAINRAIELGVDEASLRSQVQFARTPRTR